MRKRFLFVLLLAVVFVSLTGCSNIPIIGKNNTSSKNASSEVPIINTEKIKTINYHMTD